MPSRSHSLLFGVALLAACSGYDAPGRAKPLIACCGGTGTCVPKALAPAGVASRLAQDACDEASVCAPSAWIEDPSALPAACRTREDREGRCLPSCLPEVSALGELVTRESCGEEERCVPCFDPLSARDTSACRLLGDAPHERARLFPRCCGDKGRCLPSALLGEAMSETDAERLGQDRCEEQELCVPESWLETGGAAPPACRTADEREGRCLPSCLPELAEQSERLARESCEQGQLCAPCYDPLSGVDTGACRAGKDRPRDQPAPYPDCCSGTGRCVPEQALLQSLARVDLAQLGGDVCDIDTLCVPEPWLASEPARAQTCRVAGELEGRCLSRCLPLVEAQTATLAQESCADEHACVPCYDPRSGVDTGACRGGKDRPHEPARGFARCCGERGTCVPEQALLSSLSPADRARLNAESCGPDSHALCVPDAFIAGQEPSATSCRAAGDVEGRCLSTCLPQVAAQADRLAQRDCDRDQRCVPCYDPLTAEDTEACRIGRDRPREPARVYEHCCGAPGAQAGTCLPVELLSPQQVESLPVDSCRDLDTRCTPNAVLEARQLTRCTAQSLGLGPNLGLCVPECFVPLAARLFTPRATCSAPDRCVSCASLDPAQPGCE